tara:strand:+ start:22949 stop:23248 length:300 start_codon:yes stop_codon:yes gene_type:complete
MQTTEPPKVVISKETKIPVTPLATAIGAMLFLVWATWSASQTLGSIEAQVARSNERAFDNGRKIDALVEKYVHVESLKRWIDVFEAVNKDKNLQVPEFR